MSVLWEFFEFGMDMLFHTDMQKDFFVSAIHSVALNPNGHNVPVHMEIQSLLVNGEDWMAAYGGYLDIGLIDTMKDLFVNFIGAVAFSIIGYIYIKYRGHRQSVAAKLIPTVIRADDDTVDRFGNVLPQEPAQSAPAEAKEHQNQ